MKSYFTTRTVGRAWRGLFVRCKAVDAKMAIPGRIATLATGNDKIDKDRIRQTVTSDAGVPDNDLTAPGAWGSRERLCLHVFERSMQTHT